MAHFQTWKAKRVNFYSFQSFIPERKEKIIWVLIITFILLSNIIIKTFLFPWWSNSGWLLMINIFRQHDLFCDNFKAKGPENFSQFTVTSNYLWHGKWASNILYLIQETKQNGNNSNKVLIGKASFYESLRHKVWLWCKNLFQTIFCQQSNLISWILSKGGIKTKISAKMKLSSTTGHSSGSSSIKRNHITVDSWHEGT